MDQKNVSDVIYENTGLIKQIVSGFKPKDKHEFDEFVQLGRIAVWKAHSKYDSNKAKFSTMIWHYINWEIIRHLNKKKKNKIIQCDILPEKCIYDNNIYDYIPNNLSKKELEVIKMRLNGYSFIEICRKMGRANGWANGIFKSAIIKIGKSSE